jgi:DNA polymerase-3 subunit alpha
MARSGEDVAVGGIISAVRALKTRKGDPMAVATIEDRHGSLEVVVFPETFKACRPLIEVGTLVVVRGKLERDEEAARVLASDVQPIGSVRERLRASGDPFGHAPHGGRRLRHWPICSRKHRGDKPVTFQLVLEGQPVPTRVRARLAAPNPPGLVEQVEKICGPGAVHLR